MSLNWESWYSSYWAVLSVVRRNKVNCAVNYQKRMKAKSMQPSVKITRRINLNHVVLALYQGLIITVINQPHAPH